MRFSLSRIEFLFIKNRYHSITDFSLGPVQKSCFCHAELNSGIKFVKSTAEVRRLNQTKN